jgi:thioredoxin 1
MRKNFQVLLVILSVFAFSCSNGQSSSSKVNLNAADFQKKIEEFPKAPIVDVRTPEEFTNGHILNAINININSESFEGEISKLDKNKPVFVYCLSGSRSSNAARDMRAKGFKEVFELSGGMMRWRAAGFSETKGATAASAEMSMAQFNELLKTDKLVLVDVYADWCAPCKKMAPYLEEIQKEMIATVTIVRINADQNRSLSAALKVNALPTLLLYKNKTIIWSNTGFQTKDEIKSHLGNK